ncbi:bifunctional adenosylcobinamide kinase/adenosylcobinamide-phosphate guanylyltransferase [Geomesophilobacter sediminis]|uniref:Adenosylcobinamide kinase n=1 Tax=Geomesophilobacter sediminis TaxID=2798584 RepID=A0A8J7IXR6_9BACT|nr:bifunctional adenosylcobinamide kinase/adenosylcobinamide-phosphate guanylyltransferase [Geomesophilobacter sediminis]MBJ6724772.1 bifunctional adenosylcobinamide kinase/adenosylcobinamide-phosphate guanylyltransferase [Geomesophilobacter sediminis]
MGKIVLVTGGARSGKSRFAERLAEGYSGTCGYLATAEAGDAEMAVRIARHQARRGAGWATIEEPLEVGRALSEHDGRYSVILMDCLTLWISNLLFRHPAGAAGVIPEVERLIAGFPRLTTPLIMVTNEVGMGIVPEHPLARSFRDLAGEANQLVAAAADQVYVTISGMPLKLKDSTTSEDILGPFSP